MYMTHKLVLVMKKPNTLTSSSLMLLWKIKTQNLLQRVPYITKELSCFTFSSPFLSVRCNTSVKIIQNNDDIIKYLKSLPSDKK